MDPWITTFSGIKFELVNPAPSMVKIEDIAHSLSNLCRFNGHTSHFYSVAQHSINVCKILEESGFSPLIQLHGLLHDGSEAYIGDITSPLKELFCPQITTIESNIQNEVYKALKLETLNESQHRLVKAADIEMLYLEAKVLLNNADWVPNDIIPGWDNINLELVSPPEIEKQFISQYQELINGL